MSSEPTWGVVSTIKAPSTDILNFAAHHLDLGASLVHVFLDEDAPEARAALEAHPNCRVTLTDDAYWAARREGRPAKHQPRQTVNATRCYKDGPGVEWLGHFDVDEFLWPLPPGDAAPAPTIAAQLAQVPDEARSARVHAIEALAPDPFDPPHEGETWCKGHAREPKKRRRETDAIYPTFGPHLNGGFVSHVVGKVFVRTGLPQAGLRIHNAFFDRKEDDTCVPLPDARLIHCHAPDWDHWLRHMVYRLDKGSYRASLRAAPRSGGFGMNMNQLLTTLATDQGEEGLRAFFNEVCTATPDLRARLAKYGHLYSVRLTLDAARAAQFPDHAGGAR
jgi:hypothetical protein